MLRKLELLLRNKFNEFELELRDIPDSACPLIAKKVFYFDAIKERFSKEIGTREFLKSVDVIYFRIKANELYLIEIKKITRNPESKESTFSFCKRFVDNELEGKSLKIKIIDTIYILLGIMGYYNIDKDFYGFFLDPPKLKIKTFLLSDFTSEEISTMTIANMNRINIGLTNRITGETGILNCQNFIEYFND